MISGRRHRFAGFVMVVGLVAVAGGCRPAESPRHRVRGRVTFDGRPVPAGRIVFSTDAAGGFTGKDGWAPINDGTFDTAGSGYETAGGSLIARIEGGEQSSDRLPEGRLLFSNYDVPVVISGTGTELNFDVPRSAGAKERD
jgi:hypothetical protein